MTNPTLRGTQEDEKAYQLSKQCESENTESFFNTIQQLNQIDCTKITNPFPVLKHLLDATYHQGFDPKDSFRYKQLVLNYAHLYAYIAFHRLDSKQLTGNFEDRERCLKDTKQELLSLKKSLKENQIPTQYNPQNGYKFSLDMMKIALETLLDNERHDKIKQALLDYMKNGLAARLKLHAIGANATLKTGEQIVKSLTNLIVGQPNITGALCCFVSYDGLTGPVGQFKEPAKNIKQMVEDIGTLIQAAQDTKKVRWYVDCIKFYWVSYLIIQANKNTEVETEDLKSVLAEDFQKELCEKRKANWHVLYASIESLYNLIIEANNNPELRKLAFFGGEGKAPDQNKIDDYSDYFHLTKRTIKPGLLHFVSYHKKGETINWRIREKAIECCIILAYHPDPDISYWAKLVLGERDQLETNPNVKKTLKNENYVLRTFSMLNKQYTSAEKTMEENKLIHSIEQAIEKHPEVTEKASKAYLAEHRETIVKSIVEEVKQEIADVKRKKSVEELGEKSTVNKTIVTILDQVLERAKEIKIFKEIKKELQEKLTEHQGSLQEAISQFETRLVQVEVNQKEQGDKIKKQQETIAILKDEFEKLKIDTAKTKIPKVIVINEKTIHWHLPNPHPDFTGREDALKKIQKSLEQNQTGMNSQSIVGLSGVGKSALAAKYAHQSLKENRCDIVVWIQAYSQANLRNEFQQLANDYGLSIEQQKEMGIKSIITYVYQKLSEYKKVLLIFDNAKDMSVIQDNENIDPTTRANFQPPQNSQRGGEHKIDWLITTQNQIFSTHINPIKLIDFTDDEARKYIQRRLTQGTEEDADQLATLVHYFPLALSQAVSYIKENSNELSNYTIKEYIDLYQKTKEDQRALLDHKMEDDPYRQSIYTTWTIAIQDIRKDNPLSEEILNMCAYLAPDMIPITLIQIAFEEEKHESEINIALKKLRNYSLFEVSQSERKGIEKIRCIRVHRLVQIVMRLSYETDDLSDGLVKGIIALGKVCPLIKKNMNEYAFSELLIPHGEELLHHMYSYKILYKEDICELLTQSIAIITEILSDIYQDLGFVQRAIALLENLLDNKMTETRLNNEIIASYINRLGTLYLEIGETQQAIDRFKQALHIKRRQFSPNCSEVANSLMNLGTGYNLIGKTRYGMHLLKRALRIFEIEYEANQVAIGKVLTNLGIIYLESGERQLSKEVLERAIRIKEKTYGLRHIELSSTFNALSQMYLTFGEWRKAKEISEKNLEIQEEFYGQRKNVKTAATLKGLGLIYIYLDELEQAKKVLNKALKIEVKTYGSEHIAVSKTLTIVGKLHRITYEMGLAKEALEKAVKIQENFFKKDNLHIAHSLLELGYVFLYSGEKDNAEKTFRRALDINIKLFGDNDLGITDALIALGQGSLKLNKCKESKRLFKKALTIQSTFYAKDHVATFESLISIGSVHLLTGKLKKAKTLLKKAINILTDFYGKNSRKLVNAFILLATTYLALCKNEKAKQLAENTLGIVIESIGPSNILVASISILLGGIYISFENFEKSRQHLETSLSVQNILHLDQFLLLPNTLYLLGITYLMLGRNRAAKNSLERCLFLQKETKPTDLYDIEKTLSYLGRANIRQRDFESAEVNLQETYRIQKTLYQPYSLRVLQTSSNLGLVYLAKQQCTLSLELFESTLKIVEDTYPFDYLFIVQLLNNIGATCMNLRQLVKAKNVLGRAIILLKKQDVAKNIGLVAVPVIVNLCAVDLYENKEVCVFQTMTQAAIIMQKNQIDIQSISPCELNTLIVNTYFHLVLLHLSSNNLEQNIHNLMKITEQPQAYLEHSDNIETAASASHMIAAQYHILFYNIQNEADLNLAECYFQKAICLSPSIQRYIEYANYLFRQKRFPDAIGQLLIALEENQPDESCLNYGKLDKPIVEDELQNEIEQYGEINIQAIDLGFYLIIKSYIALNEQDKVNYYLNQFKNKVENTKEPFLYRLLSYLYKSSEDNETSELYLTLAESNVEVTSDLGTMTPAIEAQSDRNETRSRNVYTDQGQTTTFFTESGHPDLQDKNEANNDKKTILTNKPKSFK